MIRRRPVRSNSSMRGWSTSSWIMVGTSRTSVTPCSADRGHHGDRLEHRDHHVGAAADELAGPGGEVGQVEHRRGVQVGAAGDEEVLAGQHAERRGEQVGVAEHHALGPAGGAAGVEDGGEIVAAAAGVVRPARGRRRAARRTSSRPVRGSSPAWTTCVEVRVRRADARDVAGEGVVDDEHAGVDLGERLGDLGDAPAQVDRDDDAARPQRRGEELVIAVGVQRQDRGALAVLDAQLLQARPRGGRCGRRTRGACGCGRRRRSRRRRGAAAPRGADPG